MEHTVIQIITSYQKIKRRANIRIKRQQELTEDEHKLSSFVFRLSEENCDCKSSTDPLSHCFVGVEAPAVSCIH